MMIQTEFERPPPKIEQVPQHYPKTVNVFYVVLCLHSDDCFVFDWSNEKFYRLEKKKFQAVMLDTIYIPVDPITALAKRMVTPEEIGVNASVLATVDLLTKG
jgi:hypothetical protein